MLGGGVVYSKGFTLIELLAVIVILAIIALIATPIVLDIIDSVKKSSVEATMKNIEKTALLEYSDLVLDGKEKEEIIYNCYDRKCTYNGKTLNVKGDMPDRGRIIVNEAGTTFENIIIKGYNCIKENNKFTCNNTGLTKVNGTSILIDNNKTTEIENYRIYGNSIQNGTPTPDVPVDIESVGDLVTLDNCLSYGEEACGNVGKYVIPIKVTGKNYNKTLPIHEYDYSIDYKKYNPTNIVILPKGTYTLSGDYVPTMQFFDINTNERILVPDAVTYNKNHVYSAWDDYALTSTTTSVKRATITVLKDLKITLAGTQGELNRFQIEYGDKATEYDPYKETITNIYLDSPLRSIGEYSDYIDFKSGKVVRHVKRKTVLSSMTISKYEYKNLNGIIFYDILDQTISRGDGYCNRENKVGEYYDTLGHYMWVGVKNAYTSMFWVGVLDALEISTVDDFKNWLDNNPTYINYVLETPIEEDINLPELSINKDTSVISVNTSVVPSNIELEYYR